MNEVSAQTRTYRPWTTVVLAGIGVVVALGFVGRLVLAATSGAGTWNSVRLALPAIVVAALLAWILSNRLKLSPDSLDSRYLWQTRRIARDNIACIHDVRPIGGATSVTFILKDDSAVAVTWSGMAGAALAEWVKDLPRRQPEAA